MAGSFCCAQCGQGNHLPYIYLQIGDGGYCHCSGSTQVQFRSVNWHMEDPPLVRLSQANKSMMCGAESSGELPQNVSNPSLKAWTGPSLPGPGVGHMGIQVFLPLHMKSGPDGPQGFGSLMVMGLLQVPVARLKFQKVSLQGRYSMLTEVCVCVCVCVCM